MFPGAGARFHHHEPRPTRPKDFLITSVSLRQEERAPNAMMTCARLSSCLVFLTAQSRHAMAALHLPTEGREAMSSEGESPYDIQVTVLLNTTYYYERTLPSPSACCPEAPISYLPLPTFQHQRPAPSSQHPALVPSLHTGHVSPLRSHSIRKMWVHFARGACVNQSVYVDAENCDLTFAQTMPLTNAFCQFCQSHQVPS